MRFVLNMEGAYTLTIPTNSEGIYSPPPDPTGSYYSTGVQRSNFKKGNSYAKMKEYKKSKIVTDLPGWFFGVDVYDNVKSEVDIGRPIVLHLESNIG